MKNHFPTLDDYVFEHRNKAYGAYALRQSHDRYLTIGIFSAVALFLVLVVLPWIYSKRLDGDVVAVREVWKEVRLTTDYLLEPVKKLKKRESTKTWSIQKNAKPKVKFTSVHVVRDDKTPLEQSPPTQEQINNMIIFPEDQPGIDDGTDVLATTELTTQTGDDAVATITDEVAINTVYDFTEVMPEFDGGMAALLKYLSRHLHYPLMAVQNGIEGKVIVRFIVTKTGQVDKVSVWRGIGGGCDEEAIRVIQNMPKWNPGRHHGKEVPVSFTLPVVFKLN